MKFDEIFTNLNSEDKNTLYRDLSFFLEEIFEQYLIDNKVEYSKLDGRFLPFDYFIKTKINNLEPSTLVEIKLDLTPSMINKIINNYQNWKIKIDPQPQNLLIITTLSDLKIKLLKSHLNLDSNIHILGKKFIDSIINSNPTFSKKLLNNLSSYKLKSIVSNKNDIDWKGDRDKIISNLKGSFSQGSFSILLGAGVSCDANLPSWQQLISSLLIKSFSETLNENQQFDNESINRLSSVFKSNQLNSALLSARYLKKLFTTQHKSDEKFKKIIHEVLYTSQEINRDSILIKIITRLCIPTRIRAHIDSIITYNFDDLIEQALDSKNLKFHVITNNLEIPSLEELPIYHVHGFIPEDESKYSNNITNDIVFSEDGYHKMYAEPYHWSNLVQLTHLREKVCLMIGLSMDDPNLRRLLDIVSNPSVQPKHYAILQRVKLAELLPDSPSSQEQELAQSILQSHHQLQEQLFKDLGVNIIWYEEYADIPKILEMLLN